MYKVCIYGNGGVGKTSLTQRYLTGVFKERYQLTIGVDFYVKKFELDGAKIALHIWDFAGEEKFRFLMPSSLAGAEGVIFMYDITRFNTLKDLSDWIKMYNNAIEKSDSNPVSLLVGGKLDLKEVRAITKENALEFGRNNRLNGYIECSSKDGTNIGQIFDNLTIMMMKNKGLFSKTDKKLEVITL